MLDDFRNDSFSCFISSYKINHSRCKIYEQKYSQTYFFIKHARGIWNASHRFLMSFYLYASTTFSFKILFREFEASAKGFHLISQKSLFNHCLHKHHWLCWYKEDANSRIFHWSSLLRNFWINWTEAVNEQERKITFCYAQKLEKRNMSKVQNFMKHFAAKSWSLYVGISEKQYFQRREKAHKKC